MPKKLVSVGETAGTKRAAEDGPEDARVPKRTKRSTKTPRARKRADDDDDVQVPAAPKGDEDKDEDKDDDAGGEDGQKKILNLRNARKNPYKPPPGAKRVYPHGYKREWDKGRADFIEWFEDNKPGNTKQLLWMTCKMIRLANPDSPEAEAYNCDEIVNCDEDHVSLVVKGSGGLTSKKKTITKEDFMKQAEDNLGRRRREVLLLVEKAPVFREPYRKPIIKCVVAEFHKRLRANAVAAGFRPSKDWKTFALKNGHVVKRYLNCKRIQTWELGKIDDLSGEDENDSEGPKTPTEPSKGRKKKQSKGKKKEAPEAAEAAEEAAEEAAAPELDSPAGEEDLMRRDDDRGMIGILDDAEGPVGTLTYDE